MGELARAAEVGPVRLTASALRDPNERPLRTEARSTGAALCGPRFGPSVCSPAQLRMRTEEPPFFHLNHPSRTNVRVDRVGQLGERLLLAQSPLVGTHKHCLCVSGSVDSIADVFRTQAADVIA